MECPGAPKFEDLERKFDVLCGKLDAYLEEKEGATERHFTFYRWIIKIMTIGFIGLALGQKFVDNLPQISQAVGQSFQTTNDTAR